MRTALLGFLFLLPFQFALSPVPGIDLAVIRVISLLLAGTWLVRGLVRRRLLLPLDPAMFFVSGFLFLSVVSLFWSENGSFAVRKSLFLISFLPLFPVFVSWLREFPEDAVPFIRDRKSVV